MKRLAQFGLAAAITLSSLAGAVSAASAKDTLVITTKDGEIDIALRPDVAPFVPPAVAAALRLKFA